MKLELQMQGYFTQEEFLNTLKLFEQRALYLFGTEMTDHEELIDCDSKANFTGKISFNGQDFEEDKNDPILTNVIAEIMSDILICEEDEVLSFPKEFLNDFCYHLKQRYIEREGETNVQEIVLELMNETNLVKKCQYSGTFLVEGLIAKKNGDTFYFMDEESIIDEEKCIEETFERVGTFKWEF